MRGTNACARDSIGVGGGAVAVVEDLLARTEGRLRHIEGIALPRCRAIKWMNRLTNSAQGDRAPAPGARAPPDETPASCRGTPLPKQGGLDADARERTAPTTDIDAPSRESVGTSRGTSTEAREANARSRRAAAAPGEAAANSREVVSPKGNMPAQAGGLVKRAAYRATPSTPTALKNTVVAHARPSGHNA